MLDLAAEVREEFGPLHVFRPQRDTRFARDKTPYKTEQGAVAESEGGCSYYVRLARISGAWRTCAPLASWREARRTERTATTRRALTLRTGAHRVVRAMAPTIHRAHTGHHYAPQQWPSGSARNVKIVVTRPGARR
jgi:uncharacterized protein (DUF2461 family)